MFIDIKKSRNAQSTVELLLVLPVFMLMLFFIMDIGLLAYQTILAHHAAYEVLRIGSLVAGPPGGTKNPGPADCSGRAQQKMKSALSRFFPNGRATIINTWCEVTSVDRQTNYGHQHQDLLLELHYKAKLVFPGSNYLLSEAPKSSHTRTIKVQMRMPVEKPVFQ